MKFIALIIALLLCIVVTVMIMDINITPNQGGAASAQSKVKSEIARDAYTISNLPVCDRDAAVWEWARKDCISLPAGD